MISVDIDPQWGCTKIADILEWDYKSEFYDGYFEIIVAAPPCTEYSLAMSRRERKLQKADCLVLKILEIVEYFQPEKWWLETFPPGLLARREFIKIRICRL